MISATDNVDKWWRLFISAVSAGQIELPLPGEFSLTIWATFLRQHIPDLSDLDARELLRPLEKSGQIEYTEMLYWKISA